MTSTDVYLEDDEEDDEWDEDDGEDGDAVDDDCEGRDERRPEQQRVEDELRQRFVQVVDVLRKPLNMSTYKCCDITTTWRWIRQLEANWL